METQPLWYKVQKESELPKEVPAYFYKGEICGLSTAAFLWFANLVAMIFHSLLAFASVLVSTQGFTKSMATPRISLYLSNLTWVPNSTDALVPVFVRIDGVFLSHATFWFFVLSALAHATVVAFNTPQAFASKKTENREIGDYTGWYYRNLHRCRNPLRYATCPDSTTARPLAASLCKSDTSSLLTALLPYCVLLGGLNTHFPRHSWASCSASRRVLRTCT